MQVCVSQSNILHVELSHIPHFQKNNLAEDGQTTVRNTKGSIILRKERATLWVNPEKPGNEEKIPGNSLKITGVSIQKRISK